MYGYTSSNQRIWKKRADGGLLLRERALPGWVVLYRTDTTWASDAGGNPYVAEVLTTLDEGSANEKKSKVTQTVNAAGNVVSREVYGFGSLTAPARTFWYQYDTGSGCWHRDRVTSATQNGVQLFAAGYNNSAGRLNVPDMPMHDPAVRLDMKNPSAGPETRGRRGRLMPHSFRSASASPSFYEHYVPANSARGGGLRLGLALGGAESPAQAGGLPHRMSSIQALSKTVWHCAPAPAIRERAAGRGAESPLPGGS